MAAMWRYLEEEFNYWDYAETVVAVEGKDVVKYSASKSDSLLQF